MGMHDQRRRHWSRASTLPGFPPFIGIRIKALTEISRARARRTIELFFAELSELPGNFVVTLPEGQ